MLVACGLDMWVGGRSGRASLVDDHPDWLDGAMMTLAVSGAVGELIWGAPWCWRLVEAGAVLLLVMELWRLQVGLSRRFHRPGILLPLSFLLMAGVGALLLKIPVAVPPGQQIGWVDALFTATSAVCVTGLIVRDTATQFTPFGQVVIGLLIQLGGLGIMVFGSVLAMALGTRLSLRENLSLKAMLHDLPLRKVTSYVRFVVVATLGIELLGAAVMAPLWHGDLSWDQRAGLSVFHSISAFCNAGFALQSDNLEAYRYSPLVYCVAAPLIVIGGLGFPVLDNLLQAAQARLARWRRLRRDGFSFTGALNQRPAKLTLHTKVVLTTTAVLYLYGVAALIAAQVKPHLNAYFQQGVTANSTAPSPLTLRGFGAIVADAGFTSITARTAGFNTIPIEDIEPAGRFAVMTLMIIGASPGGTGGGMKTAAAALLVLTVVATLRRRPATEVFSRRVREEVVRKAATVAAAFFGLIVVCTGLLCLSEPYPFEKILFEAISAASTTGLSLGITGDLTTFGKVVVIATMFAGRVGPLAMIGAMIFIHRPRASFTYPNETVVLG